MFFLTNILTICALFTCCIGKPSRRLCRGLPADYAADYPQTMPQTMPQTTRRQAPEPANALLRSPSQSAAPRRFTSPSTSVTGLCGTTSVRPQPRSPQTKACMSKQNKNMYQTEYVHGYIHTGVVQSWWRHFSSCLLRLVPWSRACQLCPQTLQVPHAAYRVASCCMGGI